MVTVKLEETRFKDLTKLKGDVEVYLRVTTNNWLVVHPNGTTGLTYDQLVGALWAGGRLTPVDGSAVVTW